MHAPFKLTLTLATPFYCAETLTLDALLSAALYNATGLTCDQTTSLMPLAQESGIYKGSSLFCARHYRHMTVGRVMSLRTRNDLAMGLFAPNRRGGEYGHIDQARGPYKANMSAYPGILSPEVYFWGVGDGERAASLLSDFVIGIGKRANAGAGQILSVISEESEADYSWITARGFPARPLPTALWEKIGGNEGLESRPLAVSLPSWSAPKVQAVFPASNIV